MSTTDIRRAASAGVAVVLTIARAPSCPRATEREWLADVVTACLGEDGIAVYDKLATGARYDSRLRQIQIAVDLVDNGDASFACAHELGHWFFRTRCPPVADRLEEAFANAFAAALLGRESRDFDSAIESYDLARSA